MNLHEYQAQQWLERHGVAVAAGEACHNADDAGRIASRLFESGFKRVVLKAQIHAGGRGKGTFKSGLRGGVQIVADAGEARAKAAQMLGNCLVTLQTGPEGRQVNTLLVVGGVQILREFYCACLLDRTQGRPVLMVCSEGGMDIEQVAAQTPEKILRETIDPALGLMPFQTRKLARTLGLSGDLLGQATRLFQGIYNAWLSGDASLLEINPLALVRGIDGRESLVALDTKMSVDDNALYRQKELAAMRDLAEEAPLEIEASKHQLNYIKLEGNIACLVNGAGLAMATMDIIQHYGGRPANFLDVGGGASRDQVTAAFRIILSDANVHAILVNIFGGIMQCDIIATGIVAAVRETGLKLPLVVRLEGNNVELGQQILAESGLPIQRASSMADAAQKVVQSISQA